MQQELKSKIESESAKLAMIFSNPYAYDLANVLIKKNHLKCVCKLVAFQFLGEAAAICVQSGAKVIICRGDGARRRIQETVSIPVVSVKYSFSDFAGAIDLARQYGERIAFVVMTQDLIEAAKREKFFWQTETILLHVRDEVEARKEIQKLINDGIDVIIGGCTIKMIAEEFGVQGVLIQANEHAIREAIEDAAHTLHVFEEREARYQMISTIIETSSQALMTIGKDGRITHINFAACQLLNLTKDVIGCSYYGNVPFTDVVRKTLEGSQYNNYLFEVGSTYFVLDSAPVMVGNRPSGIVLNMQGAENVRELENKLRKRITGTGLVAKYTFRDIVGQSRFFEQVKLQAAKYADVDSTVLILGESGVGKELFAQSIHNASDRKAGPFVAVNCAAFPESILESELFGYVKGAFTGANPGGKAGIFEKAHSGTIFLDEISEMPLPLQSRLLRVIQEREIMRLGSTSIISIDIRIIAASNRNLLDEVQKGRFRADLYYRLSVLTLHIPPLREHPEDISVLIRHYMRLFSLKYDRKNVDIDDAAMKQLMQYPYYGNIRELSNIIERLVILSQSTTLTTHDIQAALQGEPQQANQLEDVHTPRRDSIPSTITSEKDRIIYALQCSNGVLLNAAQMLCISRTTLWRRLKKYGIEINSSS